MDPTSFGTFVVVNLQVGSRCLRSISQGPTSSPQLDCDVWPYHTSLENRKPPADACRLQVDVPVLRTFVWPGDGATCTQPTATCCYTCFFGAACPAPPFPLSSFPLIRRPQTIQLFIYYTKLLSTEKRLVSLNCIFERAPVEAQSLLTYT